MNRMDRLLGYLVILQSRGLVRAQDLAARFEVSERTVYRDIQVLGEVGIPIIALPGEGYRLIEGFSLPPIVFSEDEARALFLSAALFHGMAAEGATRRSNTTALEKIRAVLPKATLEQLEALSAVVSFGAVSRPKLEFDNDRLGLLQYAIQQRRVAHLRYQSPQDNQITERDIEPLHLVSLDSTWILVAHCRLRRSQRHFRVDRIDQLKLRHERFAPREFVPGAPPAEQRAVLRVDADAIRWVRERQHYGLIAEYPLETGDVQMVYLLQSAPQMLPWVLGWGGQVEVLEPAELRRSVAEAAARLAERHSGLIR
jgi:predicted DNA-binding transcriptional regulator YafY